MVEPILVATLELDRTERSLIAAGTPRFGNDCQSRDPVQAARWRSGDNHPCRTSWKVRVDDSLIPARNDIVVTIDTAPRRLTHQRDRLRVAERVCPVEQIGRASCR